MSLTRTGKINGSLIEALENVLNGPRIDFGLVRIVSAEKSGVIGICREYLTGAQLTGNGEVGMVALHTLCRTSRGIYTIHPTCEVSEFVAVNNELNIPIAEVIEQLKKSPPPLVQSHSQQIPVQPPGAQPQPAPTVNYAQMAPTDPQASSQPMRAIPPLNALGGSSVPPPPAPGGMLNRVATSIGNALSGRYKAAGSEQAPDISNSLEHSALVYDPNQINKGKGVLNQVLGHARQTLSRLNPVKSLPQNQPQQGLEQSAQENPPQNSLNNQSGNAFNNPFNALHAQHKQQAQQQFPPQPQQIQPPQQQQQQYQQPPQRPQQQPWPVQQQPAQPYQHPAQNPYQNQNQLPQQSQLPRTDQPSPYQTYDEEAYEIMPPSPPRRAMAEPQETSPTTTPKQKLTDSTIIRANELYHQQVNNASSGRKKLRNGEQQQPKNDSVPAPSAWSKLFFWRKGDE